MNKHVVRDAPSELIDAMGTFQHAPMLVANVAVRQWRFMEKLGITSARWFGARSWFTNIRAPLSLDGEHMPFDPDKPTVLTFYIPFTAGVSDQGLPYDTQSLMARAQLFAMPYREIEMTLRNQLAKTFGPHGFDHERDIGAIIANRWGHAYVIPQKGFFYGLQGNPPPRDVVRRGYGKIRFAHSELTGDQLWSTACEEGERAANQVLEIG
jgi:spermidine dehydrogenase